MKQVILLSCTKEKLEFKSKVKDLYSPSPNFSNLLNTSKDLKPDKILVISAKHHVLELEDEIEPYDLNLMDLSHKEKLHWGEEITKQLKEKHLNLDVDYFFLILDHNYRDLIEPHLKHHLS